MGSICIVGHDQMIPIELAVLEVTVVVFKSKVLLLRYLVTPGPFLISKVADRIALPPLGNY